MYRLVVVAAVGPFVFCVFVINAVVSPFPNAAAHKLLRSIEKLHIFFQTAGAVAHGVGVFALEEGLALIFFTRCALYDFAHKTGSAVHSGYNIIRPALTAVHALVMNGNFGIFLVQKVIANILALVSTGFVAQTPHGYANVVLITLVHTHNAVKVVGSPFHIVT